MSLIITFSINPFGADSERNVMSKENTRVTLIYGPKIYESTQMHTIIKDGPLDNLKEDLAHTLSEIERITKENLTCRQKIRLFFRAQINRILNFMESVGDLCRFK